MINCYCLSCTLWMYWQSTFSGFIPAMQFVEKQHNLTLKALILYKSLVYSNIFSEDISSATVQKHYTLEYSDIHRHKL